MEAIMTKTGRIHWRVLVHGRDGKTTLTSYTSGPVTEEEAESLIATAREFNPGLVAEFKEGKL